MLTTSDDVVTIVTLRMSTAASQLTDAGLAAAVDAALAELGWSFPLSDTYKMEWLVRRSIRHSCYILWIASAHKFKYKQVNLQHRFDHYEKLIKDMDEEYAAAIAENTALFANVDTYQLFGTVVGAGFEYDSIGNDITYDDLTLYIYTGE